MRAGSSGREERTGLHRALGVASRLKPIPHSAGPEDAAIGNSARASCWRVRRFHRSLFRQPETTLPMRPGGGRGIQKERRRLQPVSPCASGSAWSAVKLTRRNLSFSRSPGVTPERLNRTRKPGAASLERSAARRHDSRALRRGGVRVFESRLQ